MTEGELPHAKLWERWLVSAEGLLSLAAASKAPPYWPDRKGSLWQYLQVPPLVPPCKAPPGACVRGHSCGIRACGRASVLARMCICAEQQVPRRDLPEGIYQIWNRTSIF